MLIWDFFKCNAEAISALAAIFGAGWILVEYLRQKKERRSAQAASLEAEYDSNPNLRFALTLLDWGTGYLPVPEAYQAFLGSAQIEHDAGLLHEGLKPELTPKTRESPRATLYRLIFVGLFNHLERVLRLWHRGYVEIDDLPTTTWIVKELLDWTYIDLAPCNVDELFQPAMGCWYEKVVDGMTLASLARQFASRKRKGLLPFQSYAA